MIDEDQSKFTAVNYELFTFHKSVVLELQCHSWINTRNIFLNEDQVKDLVAQLMTWLQYKQQSRKERK